LSRGNSFINALAFLPNGHLVAGAADGTITIWNVEENAPVTVIQPAALPATSGLLNLSAPVADSGAGRSQVRPERADDVSRKRASGNPILALMEGILEWLGPAASADVLPDPNRGPGGPILVIDSASSLFGTYYAEILRAEGFNAFAVADIGSINAATLAAYDVVILAQTTLTANQVTLLTDWVNAGGNLIAMRPAPQLAGLLGITPTGNTLAEGYMRVDTGAAPGNGIEGQTMQFPGTADRYSLNGAVAVATLYIDATTATANPAVTLRGVGSSGGQAAAFAYDLATSIVYTRQGNPAWANQERDGYAPQRSDDKYFGAADTDPQPDWVDLNKVAIPQADEQQRLLANLIVHMTRDQTPPCRDSGISRAGRKRWSS
jgi:hypothetical protein